MSRDEQSLEKRNCMQIYYFSRTGRSKKIDEDLAVRGKA